MIQLHASYGVFLSMLDIIEAKRDTHDDSMSNDLTH